MSLWFLFVVVSMALCGVASAADGPLELSFRGDGAGGIFTVAGHVDAPRGALVVVGLAFDGQPVHGSWRRVEVGPDAMVRMTWPARARVLAGEYEAIASLDSGRQPRSLKSAFSGPARTLRATTYVGDPESDVGEEEVARRALLADAAAVASLSRECVAMAPITTAATVKEQAARGRFLESMDARLDEIERRLAAALPPLVFAARLPDLHETLAQTVRTFREALRVEAWRDVDHGMPAPAFLDRARRPRPPFVTLREVAIEAARVEAELEGSRAARARGPRALERLVREARRLAAELGRGDAGATDEVRRARHARRVRAATLARELALDATASALAGGAEPLRKVALDLDALAATPGPQRAPAQAALDARLVALEARLGDERARRRAEVEALVKTTEQLRAELPRLARDARVEWRSRVEALRASVAALPERGDEFFPGVRAQLILAARALVARDGADVARGSYLDWVVRSALERVTKTLPPG